MGIFQDVTLAYDGKEYVVESGKIMRAIAVVEDHVTLRELAQFSADPGSVKLVKLSTAYAALLRFAGAKVEDDEVYASMFSGGENSGRVQGSLIGLMSLMIPPGLMGEEAAEAGKALPGGTAAPSSRQRTRPQSARGASSRANSGASTPPSSGGSPKPIVQ